LEYIESAHVLGVSNARVIIRHMLPNIISTIIVFTTLSLPIPILAEAALSFLGLGLPIDTPSLGNMINVDRGHMRTAWWAVTFPGLAVAVTVLAFNFLGDGVRDALDPRLQT
jgi:peptide/nickel transport system permease protein